jgi:hypothetical protein
MGRYITDPHTDVRTPLERTSMRSSWTQPHGASPAFIHESRVLDFNLATWTVDVRSQFDQKFYPNIQVAGPYLHPNRGEGWSVVPEVNAKCVVCLPSDGPPPFVLAFIMPMETPEDPSSSAAAEDAADTTGTNQGAVFSGGRARGKPGDMIWQGRDGNFVIMHRGGVLQVGSTELAQRIYIPLGNIITDISQNYEHHNTGGSINWGLSTSYTDDNPQTEFRQTFRLFANDAQADLRIAVGQVHQPVPEPSGDAGETSNNTAMGVGADTIVAEFVIAPAGFNVEAGSPVSGVENLTKLKMFFDRSGSGFLRAEASVNIRVKNQLRITADQGMTLTSGKSLQLQATENLRLVGSTGVQITSDKGAVTINGGDTPVATVGSAVSIVIATPVPIILSAPVPGTPGVISAGAMFTGFITNGSSTVLVPGPQG